MYWIAVAAAIYTRGGGDILVVEKGGSCMQIEL